MHTVVMQIRDLMKILNKIDVYKEEFQKCEMQMKFLQENKNANTFKWFQDLQSG